MRRFRYTLIAVCLVLLYLGGCDLLLWYQNPAPQVLSIQDLEQSGPPRAWLQVEGGYLDLDRAISTSGTVEMEALLIPLLTEPRQEQIRVLIETRDPQLLELFKQYHFFTDTLPEKQAFRAQHAASFLEQRPVTGMQAADLVSRNNHQKMLELAKEIDLQVTEDILFLSEGKTPALWRGLFFFVTGLLGLGNVLRQRRPKLPAAVDQTG